MSDTIAIQLDLNIRQDEDSLKELFTSRIQEAFGISEWGEVTGSSIITAKGNDEPVAATITIQAPSLHDEQITGFITLVEQFGAPVGSKLTIQRDEDSEVETHDVGKVHGLAIYLDGVNLDKKIYKKYDLENAWDAINNELGEHGMAYGCWHGHAETAIYSYGPLTDAMQEHLAGLLRKHPLFRGAREVVLPDTLPS